MRTCKIDKYLVNINDYKRIDIIAKGGFAFVDLLQSKDGKKYAVKRNINETSKSKLLMNREINILIKVQHPTIINFHGFSYTYFGKDQLTILTDYMEKGTLAKLISLDKNTQNTIKYNNTIKQIILIGIARGMMILHKHHIIHRDLKPENVLIDENFHPHISDFGLSKFFNPNFSTMQSIEDTGTFAYMAPEVISSNHFNIKADVYSFGVLMYEILTGVRVCKIYPKELGINGFNFKNDVVNKYRPNIEENSMKKSFQNMIKKCWEHDPTDRPTFSELYQKLSLTIDDFAESNVIDNNENDTEKKDELEIKEDLYLINRNYCLDDVDINAILDYVNTINEDPLSPLQREYEKTIQTLNAEIENLKKITEKQGSTISELTVKLEEEKKLFSCRYSDDTKTKGIISFLNNYILISHGGNKDDNYPIDNIKIYQKKFFCNYERSSIMKAFFDSTKQEDNYIEFDFGPFLKIDLYSYFIQSNDKGSSQDCHPKTWRIRGSKDKTTWVDLDIRENNNSLNGSLRERNFECKRPNTQNETENNEYRYIRYVQEESWQNKYNYNIFISFIELFGDISFHK